MPGLATHTLAQVPVPIPAIQQPLHLQATHTQHNTNIELMITMQTTFGGHKTTLHVALLDKKLWVTEQRNHGMQSQRFHACALQQACPDTVKPFKTGICKARAQKPCRKCAGSCMQVQVVCTFCMLVGNWRQAHQHTPPALVRTGLCRPHALAAQHLGRSQGSGSPQSPQPHPSPK